VVEGERIDFRRSQAEGEAPPVFRRDSGEDGRSAEETVGKGEGYSRIVAVSRFWIDLFEWVLKGLYPEQPVIRRRTVAFTLIVASVAIAQLSVAVGMSLVAVCLALAVSFLRRLLA